MISFSSTKPKRDCHCVKEDYMYLFHWITTICLMYQLCAKRQTERVSSSRRHFPGWAFDVDGITHQTGVISTSLCDTLTACLLSPVVSSTVNCLCVSVYLQLPHCHRLRQSAANRCLHQRPPLHAFTIQSMKVQQLCQLSIYFSTLPDSRQW